jgi:hypothetical protein
MKMEDIQFSSVIISNDLNKSEVNSYRNNYFKYSLAGKLIAAGHKRFIDDKPFIYWCEPEYKATEEYLSRRQ